MKGGSGIRSMRDDFGRGALAATDGSDEHAGGPIGRRIELPMCPVRATTNAPAH